MKKIYSLVIIIILSLNLAFADGGWGLGPSVAYNPQTKSLAVGFRVNIKPSARLRLVPQALYYPSFSFNNIHEYHIGLGVEFTVLKNRIFNIYPLINVGYNVWLNADESDMKSAKEASLLFEGGLGVSFTRAVARPFIEMRYNVKWKESSVHLGVLFVLGSNGKGRYGRRRNRRKAVGCPAYN